MTANKASQISQDVNDIAIQQCIYRDDISSTPPLMTPTLIVECGSKGEPRTGRCIMLAWQKPRAKSYLRSMALNAIEADWNERKRHRLS